MESIANVWDSVKSYIKERLTNPLYGAFLISWAIVNFRLLLVVTGVGSWQDKITYIDSRLYVHWSDWCLYGYVYPLIAAILYLFLAPIVNRGVTVYLRHQDKITIERLLEIEGETPIPKPEAEQLRKGLLSERAARLGEQQESSEKLAELSRQIDTLLAENKQLKKGEGDSGPVTVGDLTVAAKKLEKEDVQQSETENGYRLDEKDFVGVDQKTVLTAVGRGLSQSLANGLLVMSDGDTWSIDQVQGRLKLNSHKAKVLFDQLRGMKLIEQLLDRNSDPIFKITSAGSQALEAVMHRGFSAAQDKLVTAAA